MNIRENQENEDSPLITYCTSKEFYSNNFKEAYGSGTTILKKKYNTSKAKKTTKKLTKKSSRSTEVVPLNIVLEKIIRASHLNRDHLCKCHQIKSYSYIALLTTTKRLSKTV